MNEPMVYTGFNPAVHVLPFTFAHFAAAVSFGASRIVMHLALEVATKPVFAEKKFNAYSATARLRVIAQILQSPEGIEVS